MTHSVRCPEQATVRQVVTHAALLRNLMDPELRGLPRERSVCTAHAEWGGKDWRTVAALPVSLARRQCEYLEDAEG